MCSYHKKFSIGTIWLLRAYNLLILIKTNILQELNSLICLMKLLLKWHNTTLVSFKQFFQKIMKVYVQWLLTFWKFKIQYIGQEKSSHTLKNFTASLTKSCIMFKKWQMSLRKEVRLIFSSMHTKEFWKIQRNLTNLKCKKNLML